MIGQIGLGESGGLKPYAVESSAKMGAKNATLSNVCFCRKNNSLAPRKETP